MSSAVVCPVALSLDGKRAEAEAALASRANEARDRAEDFSVKALLSLVHTEGELFLGGNDTPTLLHLLAARPDSKDDAGIDLLASVLVPEEHETCSVLDARGPAALDLSLLYWRAYPDSPIVVRRADFFSPVMLSGKGDHSWCRGAATLRQARNAVAAGAEELELQVPQPILTQDSPPLAAISPAVQGDDLSIASPA